MHKRLVQKIILRSIKGFNYHLRQEALKKFEKLYANLKIR